MWNKIKDRISIETSAVIFGWIAGGIITGSTWWYYSPGVSDIGSLIIVKGIQSTFGILFTLVLFRIFNRLEKYKLLNHKKIIVVILLCYFFSIGLALINFSTFRYYLYHQNFWGPWSQYLYNAFIKFVEFLMFSTLYYLIQYWRQYLEQREKALRATALARQAQLQMLQYQLNPHFLFNALNSIRTMVYKNRDKARDMITDLSEFLRYSLVNTDKVDVRLGDEMKMVENYLDIQKIRFEDDLNVHIDIQPEARDIHIPCFLIHPLVENALKYGKETSAIPLKLHISAVVSDQRLSIKVINTGKLIEPVSTNNNSNSTGTGLINIRKRLEHLFPGDHDFQLFQENGKVNAIIEVGLKRLDKD